MGKNYKLNQIPLRTKEDALEFIDVVQAKLPLVKNLLNKQSLEITSLKNRVSQMQQAAPSNYSNEDVQTSVLERATNKRTVVDDGGEANRLAQLQAAQAPQPPVDPGEIGQLDLDPPQRDGDLGLDFGGDVVTPPTEEDLTPIGTRVAGKAESLKVVERRQQANDLRN